MSPTIDKRAVGNFVRYENQFGLFFNKCSSDLLWVYYSNLEHEHNYSPLYLRPKKGVFYRWGKKK